MSFEDFNARCKEVFGATASSLLYVIEDLKQRIVTLEESKAISDPIIGATIAKVESIAGVIDREIMHINFKEKVDFETTLIINNAKSNVKRLKG